MIGYIKGTIVHHEVEKSSFVIMASDGSAGVGYSVQTPRRPSYQNKKVGDCIELFIYSHIREDSFDLYGFEKPNEKFLFTKLLQVKGVGPKLGISVFSAMTPEQLLKAVIEKDKALLGEISGVGKKTSEQIMLDLSEPLKKLAQNPEWKNAGIQIKGSFDSKTDSPYYNDARLALLQLGFKENLVPSMLSSVLENLPEPKGVEEWVRHALSGNSNL